MRLVLALGVFAVVGCAGASDTTTTTTDPTTSTVFNADAPLDPDLETAIDDWLATAFSEDWDVSGVDDLVETGDVRTAWLIADLLRFYQRGDDTGALTAAFLELTGATPDPGEVEFVWATNHLIAEDVPAWDGYADDKRLLFGGLEPLWDQFFAEDRGIDWRMVTWGGVAPDRRALDDNRDCPCIPALDHPETTDAAAGDWYANNRIVFGLVVGDEAIALPKHQMEVHEMVHVTLGGRELGIPYCTLCGSAQAYFVDDVPGVDRVVLRTSGLLQRSNKLMYDLTTGSAIDTFTGKALTGQLAEDNFTLDQVSVIASTWGDWKEAHPRTRIIAQDGGIDRTYVDDPLQGRDDAGPIFPIGDVDDRLLTQERVVGVVKEDGTPVAFPVMTARTTLAEGPIEFEDLTVRLEDGIRVYGPDGEELVSHESFWFAWSQFHEGTLLWDPEG